MAGGWHLLPLHPLFFAAYPAVWVYWANHGEVEPSDLELPLALAIGSGAALWALAAVWLRDRVRSAALASLALVWVFHFGHVQGGIEQARGQALPLAATSWLLFAWLALGVAAGWGLARRRSPLGAVTPVLDAVAVALVAVPLAAIGLDAVVVSDGPTPSRSSHAQGEARSRPDIYYLILDGYGASQVLARLYDLDDRAFLAQLEERGFFVARESHSNYSQTALSLASSLSYRYLDELTSRPGRRSKDKQVLRPLLARPSVLDTLARHGYASYAFRSGYRLANQSGADHLLEGGITLSEFQNAILDLTPLPHLFRRFESTERLDRYRAQVLFPFDSLPRLAERPGPKFVFVHVVSPHPPFVFDANGHPVDTGRPLNFLDGSHYLATASREEYVEGYRNQAIFIARKTVEAVTGVLAASNEPPIIVIQADHGPGSRLDQESVDASDVVERMSILNAYHLPGPAAQRLYPEISPVNTFRIILNEYFGEDLPLLPDRSFFSLDERPYDFRDVTDRL